MGARRSYWYAIVPAARPVPLSKGVRGAALYQVTVDELAAVVSSAPEEGMRLSLDDVLVHEQVVEELGHQTEWRILPVRVGMVSPTEAVVSILRERYRQWADGLTRIAGCVEMSLKALWAEGALPSEVAPAPEAATWSGPPQGEPRRPAWDVVPGIDRALSGLYREKQTEEITHFPLAFAANYLVPYAAVEAFSQAVQHLMKETAGLRFLCTGPWPAYHFVSREEGSLP